MPNYDRQLIVLFLTGEPGDQAIINNSKGLHYGINADRAGV